QRQRAHTRALVELALELVAELIEIVLVARREEIVGRADHFQNEITGRPGLARCHRAIAEHALAVLVDTDLLLDLISVHDSHGVPPVSLLQRRAATLRVAESLMYKAFGHNDLCDQRRRKLGKHPCGSTPRSRPP